MNARFRRRRGKRRGAIVVVFAFALVVFVAMAAVAVDFAWITLAKNQLQVSADAAAMAAAGELATSKTTARSKALEYVGYNPVGGQAQTGTASNEDIVFGIWDKIGGTFTASETGSNSVEVTVHKELPLIFARLLGVPSVNLSAKAVGVTGPRDIAFVIDLSGSMNNDTEIWATSAINAAFPTHPTIGTDIMANVFSDFGFGSYPGTVWHVGQGLAGAPNNDTSYQWLANTYLLNNSSVSTTYRTLSTDSASTRKTKTYKWIIDNQLATIMPAAKPTPNSANTTSLAYWTAYLDYIIKPYNSLPPNQNSYRISTGSNPYTDAWPDLTSSTYTGFQNKLGYQTYVQFMMDYGRNKIVTGSTYAQLSTSNADMPLTMDTNPNSPGYNLQFPPREQPTHSVRLAVLAAVNQIATLNSGRPETSKDHIAIISFDNSAGTTVRYPLNVSACDYSAVKNAVRMLQACSDAEVNTASENGLALAKTHLNPATNPSGARPSASKVVVFLSDGIANVKQSSSTTINNFISSKPSSDWFTTGSYKEERNAAMMQSWQMQLTGWRVYAVGVGLGADRSLMDRLARFGDTAQPDPLNPGGPKVSPYASGNPGDYQALLTAIFSTIIGAPSIQLGL